MKKTITTAILTIAITFSGTQLFAQSQDNAERVKLENYFAKYNIQYNHSALGEYFTLVKVGKGKQVMDSAQVKIRYKEHVFNENKKTPKSFPNLKNVKPVLVKMGSDKYTQGLEYGVCYLPKGSKVTIYVPSSMAYGEKKHGKIPPNSILVYDVEILN